MDGVVVTWRGSFTNDALNALHADAFDHSVFDDDWTTMVDRHSLGWVTATAGDELVGFLNVLWDGGVHAWLQDVIVVTHMQRKGLGMKLIEVATNCAREADCEWLHVDFDPEHAPFYFDACGFTPTNAGLLRLTGPE